MKEKIERNGEIKERKNEEGNPVFCWYSNIRTARVRQLRSELDCALRGRGSLLLWLVLF